MPNDGRARGTERFVEWLADTFDPDTVSVLFGIAALLSIIVFALLTVWFAGAIAGWWGA